MVAGAAILRRVLQDGDIVERPAAELRKGAGVEVESGLPGQGQGVGLDPVPEHVADDIVHRLESRQVLLGGDHVNASRAGILAEIRGPLPGAPDLGRDDHRLHVPLALQQDPERGHRTGLRPQEKDTRFRRHHDLLQKSFTPCNTR